MPETEAPPQPASLVVRGRFVGWVLPSLLAGSGVGAIAGASIYALSELKLPFMFQGLNTLVASCPSIGLGSFVAFVLGASFALARSSFLGRAGRVELNETGIVYSRRRLLKKTVPWSDVEAYSDAHATWVDVFRRGQTFPRPRYAIPTLDEMARAGVLDILDARGLRRVESRARRRSLAHTLSRSLVWGAIAVLVFHALVYTGNARLRQYQDLCANKLSKEEADALVARWVSVRHAVRQAIGTEDALAIEMRHEMGPIPALFVPERLLSWRTETRAFLDGREVAVSAWDEESHGSMGYSTGIGRNCGLDAFDRDDFLLKLHVDPDEHRLRPGSHDLRVTTRVRFEGGVCEKETLAKLEVVPGSIVERTVKLVTGVSPKVTLERPSWAPGWNLLVSYEDLPCPLAVRFELEDGGSILNTGSFIAPAHEHGGHGLGTFGFTSGHHVLKVKLMPDARLAFERDPGITEVVGEPFERELVLDVP